MSVAALLLVALAPGLFWLWFFVRKNSYRPEPRRLLALTFIVGMVAVFPAAIIEGVLISDSVDSRAELGLGTAAIVMLLVVGPVEEVTKFLVVRLGAYRTRYFEEPMDGLVYAAAASLGFATAENFFYMSVYGAGVILIRAPLSTLGHLIFGTFWGYALGRSQGARHRWALVAAGLVTASAAHGVFNLGAVAGQLWAPITLVVLGGIWTLTRFNWARRTSPFRLRQNYPLVECPSCGQPARVTEPSCAICGTSLRRAPTPIVCGNCRTVNRPDASFCTRCGDRFVEVRR